MREKLRGRGTMITVAVLFVIAVWLGLQGGRSIDDHRPRARFTDAKPLGGKGLQFVLRKLGYAPQRHTARIETMPANASAWLILDPDTNFSRQEARVLLRWLKNGGTLVWAESASGLYGSARSSGGIQELRQTLKVRQSGDAGFNSSDLPAMTPLSFGTASDLRAGVRKASASGGTLTIERGHVELAGNPNGVEIGVIPFGKGRAIVLPDALLCTNYGLSKDDNAVLVTNFIRAYAPTGAVYFDERNHDDPNAPDKIEPNLLYYLNRGGARLAILQLLAAGLLLWAFYGRRLGAPVPIPDREPVTRAGQFAMAMGMLFRKANRPAAAAEILGEEFRRSLARRLGLSPHDPDALIADAAARASGLPARLIDRLLLKSRNPASAEAEALADAQDMEMVLRRLDQQRDI